MTDTLEFKPPYSIEVYENSGREGVRLLHNGWSIASFSVTAWGGQDKAIQAAWNHAYGEPEVSLTDIEEAVERIIAAPGISDLDERDIASLIGDWRRLRAALTDIAGRGDIEMALDPEWAKRVARAALSGEKS